MTMKQWVSLAVILVMLFCSVSPALATGYDGTGSFDDYVMSHPEEFENQSIYSPGGIAYSSNVQNASDPIDLEGPENAPRYSLLLLDVSGSMSGTPITKMKQAAIKFCEQILQADTTENYIGVVSFTDNANTLCMFTDDIEELRTSINRIIAGGLTSQYAPLLLANQIFDANVPEHAIKNIVLLSDGLPEGGQRVYSGRYSSSEYWGYSYANAAYNLSIEMHEDYSIYTLGFFHSLYSVSFRPHKPNKIKHSQAFCGIMSARKSKGTGQNPCTYRRETDV